MLTNNKAIIVICVLGVILSILLSGLYFRFSYFEPDTVSYSFQAKLFARGKLSVEAPPEYGFSSSPHVNILNGKWYSKYPFGNALMLTLGEFVNVHCWGLSHWWHLGCLYSTDGCAEFAQKCQLLCLDCCFLL